MVAVVNARDARNGWGVNVPEDTGSAANVATALGLIQTRWVRFQIDGNSSAGVQAIQNALVSQGVADPNLKVQLLLNDYIQNASTNTFTNQSTWILNSFIPIKGPNGKSVIACIEGPNEMNDNADGNGARGPNDTTNKTGNNSYDTVNDPVPVANFVDWATQLYNLKQANQATFSGIELITGTILDYNARTWNTALNCTGKVNYGTFHYYSGLGGTNGCPNYPPDPDNSYFMYNFAKAAILPGGSLVQSEGGCSTQTSGGYGQDGRSAARYQIIQILSHLAMGGHRYMIYNLFNNSVSTKSNVTSYNEDNFGQFYGDQVTPKQSVYALHNFANLMSLNNNYASPANFADTASFTPGYNGNGFSVTGIQNAGSAGYAVIFPKSDGSTMIGIWNEPTIDTGSGTSTTISANNITVNFGSNQSYKVYDVMGGGNVNAFTATYNGTTAIASGTGTTVNLTLYANPLFIELSGTPAPTVVPGATTLSAGATTATTQVLNWTLPANSATDFILTVTEVT